MLDHRSRRVSADMIIVVDTAPLDGRRDAVPCSTRSGASGQAGRIPEVPVSHDREHCSAGVWGHLAGIRSVAQVGEDAVVIRELGMLGCRCGAEQFAMRGMADSAGSGPGGQDVVEPAIRVQARCGERVAV